MPFESDRNVTIFIKGDTSDFKAKVAEVTKLATNLSKLQINQNFLPKDVEKRIQTLTSRVDKLEKELDQVKTAAKGAGQGFSAWQAAIVTANQALQLVGGAVRTARQGIQLLTESLDRASEVEGLNQSFNNLQLTVGRVGNEALPRLREATKGLISDFDLFQATNNAVILGVDKGEDAFFDLAEAAVVLGRATGRDAVNAFNDLAFGIGRQSRLILDNLGIVVRAEQAYKDFAAAQGLAVAALTDSQQREAFRVEAFRAVREATAQLSAIQETAAISSQRLAASFTNQRDAFVTALSSSVELQSAFSELDSSINSINVEGLGRAVGELAAKFINLGSTILSQVLQGIQDFNTGLDVLEVLLRRVSNSPIISFLTTVTSGFKDAASSVIDFTKNLQLVPGLEGTGLGDAVFNALPIPLQNLKKIFDLGSKELSESISTAYKEGLDKAAANIQNSLDTSFSAIKASGLLGEDFVSESKVVFQTLQEEYEKFTQAFVDGAELTEEQSKSYFIIEERLKSFAERIKDAATTTEESSNITDKSSKKIASAIESISAALTKSSINTDPTSSPIVQTLLEIEAKSDGTKEAVAAANAELIEFIRLNASAANLPEIRAGVGIITGSRGESTKLTNDISDLRNEIDKGISALPSFSNTLDDLEKRYAFGAVSLKEYNEEIRKLTDRASEDKNISALQDIADSVQNINDATKAREGFISLFADADIAGISAVAKEIGRLDSTVDGALSGGLGELAKFGTDLLLEQLTTGDISASGRDIGAAVGGIIGGIIGSFIPVVGTAIGAAIGTVIGAEAGDILSGNSDDIIEQLAKDLIFFTPQGGIFQLVSNSLSGQLLGLGNIDLEEQIIQLLLGGNEQRQFRDSLQAFFNDLANEIEFQGRLFGKGGLFESSEFVQDAFNVFELPDGTSTTAIEERIKAFNISQEQINNFQNLGFAFAELLGVADEFGGVAQQIGLILASELRDPQGLNELQVLLKANGITAEDFGKSLEEAFSKGDISAREFLSTVAATNELLAPGIPFLEGGVDVAFDNIAERAQVSGLEAQDAFQDLAIEAQELGIPFEDLGKVLQETFNIPTEQVEKLIGVLAEQGITTFEQLANIDLTQTAQLVTGLEDVGFAFVDVSESAIELGLEVDEVTEKVKALQEQAGKETELNIKVKVDTSEFDEFQGQLGGTETSTDLETSSSNPE